MAKLNSMTAEDRAALDAEVAAGKAEGLTIKQLQAKHGMNHSQVELAIMRATFTPEQYANFQAGGATLAEQVVAARAAGTSWGVIGVLARTSESAVRKAYAEATQVRSQGLRIGKGGRWYLNEPQLYTPEGELVRTGTAIPAGSEPVQKAGGTRALALKSALQQRLERLDFEQVCTIAAKYGITHKKGGSKHTLIKAIVAANDAKVQAS